MAYHRKAPVYVDTWELPPDRYFVSPELPPELDDDFPYIPAGELEVHSFDKPVEAIQKTLRLRLLNEYMRPSS